MNLSRRDLLRYSASVGLACLYARDPGRVFALEPHLKFPRRPRARLALTSWPFRAYMESTGNSDRDPSKPGMNVVAFAKMAIEKFGIHNINPLGAHLGSTAAGDLEAVREGVAKAGSHFVDLGLEPGKFFDPDPAVRKSAVEKGKQWIDIAAALGSPSVRQHIGNSRGASPNVDLTAQNLGELAAYAAKKNIVVNLENDSLASEDPFFIVHVIEKAGDPYLRALPDFGNTAATGDPDYNYRGLEAMFPHAFNMSHVKRDVMKSGKVYTVDLAKVFGIAKASGYRGYYSMECESRTQDPFQGTMELVRQSLKYLS